MDTKGRYNNQTMHCCFGYTHRLCQLLVSCAYTFPVTEKIMQDTLETQRLLATYQIDCVCEACDPSKPGNEKLKHYQHSDFNFHQYYQLFEMKMTTH